MIYHNSKIRKWNVIQSLYLELWIDEGQVLEAHENRVLPAAMLEYVQHEDDEHLYELEICFHSKGYYDPGSMYGGPDNLGWPPEGDDERLMVHVHVHETDLTAEPHAACRRVIRELAPKLQEELFELFLDEVREAELDGD